MNTDPLRPLIRCRELFYLSSTDNLVHSNKYIEPVKIILEEGAIQFGCSSIEVAVIEKVLAEHNKRFGVVIRSYTLQ